MVWELTLSARLADTEGAVAFVRANARKLSSAIDDGCSDRFEFFGIRTVYDRYLLKDPTSRGVIESLSISSCGPHVDYRSLYRKPSVSISCSPGWSTY